MFLVSYLNGCMPSMCKHHIVIYIYMSLIYGIFIYMVYIGLFPFPVIVTTRIFTFLVGDPCKPSLATIT